MARKDKLGKFCIKEAKKEKAWAERFVKNRRAQASASDYTKRWAQEAAASSVSVLAKKTCRYIKIRACMSYDYASGQKAYTDPTAREQYKRIVGRYPKCH